MKKSKPNLDLSSDWKKEAENVDFCDVFPEIKVDDRWKREMRKLVWRLRWARFKGRIVDPFLRIGTIISYIPILWKDNDWDYAFFLILMRKKLQRMEKHFREDGVASVSKRDAQRMRETIKILDKLIEDDYLLEYPTFRGSRGARTRDLDKFLNKLRKHLFGWWD